MLNQWTVARYPSGKWDSGGRPTDPAYAECEVFEVLAETRAQAVKKAQSKRSSLVRKAKKIAPDVAYEDYLVYQKALETVGDEYGTTRGVCRVMVVEGAFATAIMSEQVDNEQGRIQLGIHEMPVQIRRSGPLEIWCNGFYIEGSHGRRLVHRAVRKMLGQPEPSDEQKAVAQAALQAMIQSEQDTASVLIKVSAIAKRAGFTGISEELKRAASGKPSLQVLKQALYVASEECDAALIDLVNAEIDKVAA